MVKNNLNFLFSKYLQIIGLELKLKKKNIPLYFREETMHVNEGGEKEMRKRNRRRNDN